MKEQFTTQVQVKGRGNTKEKAFADALSHVQSTVLQQSASNVLLRIEPQEVVVLEALESIKTEKFLFFFLARKRYHYQVTLAISVSITAFDVDKVAFTSLT